MFELQEQLLEKQPTRRELLEYVPVGTHSIRICVYRNHSFELVEHTIGAYLDFSNLKASFSYSDYDDSLSFINLDKEADLLILWLDLSRYDMENISAFINERISVLRQKFDKPILLIAINGSVAVSDNHVICMDYAQIKTELSENFLDDRMEFATGTRLSARALVRFSKELGLKYIPAIVFPSLKAIVVDLDNTLYKGVLGEDGISGVVLTNGHRLLQEFLKSKSQEGFFICVISKNDKKDVEELFKTRTDFPLKLNDFTVVEASWDDKAKSMAMILQVLNIGVDSVLFVDDNLGELAQMQVSFPKIKEIHALDDAFKTLNVIECYPGLIKLSTKEEDAFRSNDVKSNLERKKMQTTLSKEDYIKSLQMKLTYNINVESFSARIAELANKTNQFIFNYKRYDLSMVENLMHNDAAVIMSVTLSDKLSNSGTIAVCVGKAKENYMELEECFVSCRALGRGIDDIIVLGMIKIAADTLGFENLKVCFKKGERNLPAENFINKYLKNYINQVSPIDFSIDDSLVEIQVVRG